MLSHHVHNKNQTVKFQPVSKPFKLKIMTVGIAPIVSGTAWFEKKTRILNREMFSNSMIENLCSTNWYIVPKFEKYLLLKINN